MKLTVQNLAELAVLAAIMLLCGCGYHVTGNSSALLPDVRTLAIPVFTNQTVSYRIEQTLTQAVVREFNTRSSYHVVSNPNDADAVLRGAVTSVTVSPLTFDSVTGRLSSAMVTVNANISLKSRDGKVLFQNPSYSFRQQYEVARESSGFFQEQSPAVERLSRDFAQTLVSDILENY